MAEKIEKGKFEKGKNMNKSWGFKGNLFGNTVS